MLGFIHHRNTGSDRVVVHELEADGSRFLLSEQSGIFVSDAPNFIFDFVPRINGNHDLCAIKVRNTDSGNVEVHVLSRNSGYRDFTLHATTPISLSDAPNFEFVMGKSNGELIGIKRRNTASGRVEVHLVSHLSGYRDFILHAVTPLELVDILNFDFGGAILDRAVFIKRDNTGTRHVEVHILTSGGTRWDFQQHTGMSLPSVVGHTLLLAPFPVEVVSLTNGPTASGFVEIVQQRPVPVSTFPAPPPRPRPTVFSANRIEDVVFKMIGTPLTAGGGGGF